MSALRALRQASSGLVGAAKLTATRRTGAVLARGATIPSASVSKVWGVQGVQAFSATARSFGTGTSEYSLPFSLPFPFCLGPRGPQVPRFLFILKFEKVVVCTSTGVGARREKLPIPSHCFFILWSRVLELNKLMMASFSIGMFSRCYALAKVAI